LRTSRGGNQFGYNPRAAKFLEEEILPWSKLTGDDDESIIGRRDEVEFCDKTDSDSEGHEYVLDKYVISLVPSVCGVGKMASGWR